MAEELTRFYETDCPNWILSVPSISCFSSTLPSKFDLHIMKTDILVGKHPITSPGDLTLGTLTQAYNNANAATTTKTVVTIPLPTP
jgi:hypothetical protein